MTARDLPGKDARGGQLEAAARDLRRGLVIRASVKLSNNLPVRLAQFGDGGEAVPEGIFGGAEGPAGGGVDEQVVAGHVEGVGQADDRVGGRGNAGVTVVADLGGRQGPWVICLMLSWRTSQRAS